LDTSGNTVLITGGGTGIGFALAEAFVSEGNDVVICGRRESKLREAKRKLPKLHFKRFDVAKETDRQSLLRWVTSNFEVNILINNAGIQRKVDYTSPYIAEPTRPKDDEVTINFTATIRLCALFVPKLMKKRNPAIVNISSGLGVVPIASMPIYCATKAAIHSFTTSLRHQLRDTPIPVFEAVCPTTDTELDRSFAGEEEEAYRGISPNEVASAIIEGLKADKLEMFIGEAQGLYKASREDPESIFHRLNG
jgi:uncharacterized oxidoreductase